MNERASESRLKIRNFDEFVPKRKKTNVDPLLMQPPFRAILCGGSGSGKTNFLMNCLVDFYKYETCHVFLKDPSEDKYSLLDMFFKKIQDSNPDFEYLITNNLDLIPDLNELDPELNHMMVFDDLLSDASIQPVIEDMYLRGRKRNVSLFYLAQRFGNVPKLVRSNTEYFLFWKQSRQEQTLIYKAIGGFDKDAFYRMFTKATRKPFDFFMVDRKSQDGELSYRKNLLGVGLAGE